MHERGDAMAALVGPPPSTGDLVAGRYRLGSQIGWGGMGRVFRARDTLLGRDIAVKVLHARPNASRESDAAHLGEARAAARLAHPNIARVLDTGIHAGAAFIAVELIDGEVLSEILAERGRLHPRRAAEIAADLAGALGHAHRHGVVHCDVKPQNIVLTRGGVPKLVDFGVARTHQGRTTVGSDETRGTAAYIAPEQVLGQPVDGRADLYALGAVLYEMLAGRPPFAGATVAAVVSQRLVADPVPLRALRPGLSVLLAGVVMRALAREPDERVQTGEELRVALLESIGRRGWPLELLSDSLTLCRFALGSLWSATRRGERPFSGTWHAACNVLRRLGGLAR